MVVLYFRKPTFLPKNGRSLKRHLIPSALFLTVAVLLFAHVATWSEQNNAAAPSFIDALLWLVLIILSSMASHGSAGGIWEPRENEIRGRFYDSRYYYGVPA